MTVKAIEVYEIFKEIGLKEDKAEKIVNFVQETAEGRIEQEIKELVTNETFLKEVGRLREDMANMKGGLREDMANMKGGLREDMANMKAEIIKWNVGTIIAVASIVAAIVRFLK